MLSAVTQKRTFTRICTLGEWLTKILEGTQFRKPSLTTTFLLGQYRGRPTIFSLYPFL